MAGLQKASKDSSTRQRPTSCDPDNSPLLLVKDGKDGKLGDRIDLVEAQDDDNNAKEQDG